MTCGREASHVEADLRQDRSGGDLPDTRNLNDKIITVKTIEEIWAPLLSRDK